MVNSNARLRLAIVIRNRSNIDLSSRGGSNRKRQAIRMSDNKVGQVGKFFFAYRL